MKQFHAKYQDAAKLEEMVTAADVRNWISLHKRRGRQYRPENPDLPTLHPWHNTTTAVGTVRVHAQSVFPSGGH